ncbi:hypothetical protein CY34DRAFT_110266 [Suillus luteus UH-Slu-Lm8-n1]|uniref:MARVEL domain-containing protein n=1 Tax=Suillus luteus UH-Slu-Lm8-n1 TaxID=930992 RepID=A0A0D0AJT0_9AGAM|nr:hypothetical protein CY34DRAFT_110266 [Suillus luteus UH-Slu-Lm8-n1]
MAVLPWFRAIIFSLISALALVVVGIYAHIEALIAGYHDINLTFVALGLAAGCLTVVSLPLFLILGRVRRGAVTSMIVFEIIWFLVIWLVWVGTAVDTVAGRAYYFPDGCIYTDYPTTNQICYEVTVAEGAAFIIFFSAFIYYDTIVLYAIIQAIRGKGVWTSSIAAASEASGLPPTQPMHAPQYTAVPGGQAPYPAYGDYPQNAHPQPYNGYPTQPPNPQYYNYPPGIPASGNIHPSPGGYSPALSGNAALPPQPNYAPYPAANQGQILPSDGYQEQPHYGISRPIPV